jgi:hypothetical protein
VCAHAVRLYEQYRNEPEAGIHYEEFVLLAARSIARAFETRDVGGHIQIARTREAFFEIRHLGERSRDRSGFAERLLAALHEG